MTREKLKSRQQDAADLAAILQTQARQLKRWANELPDPRYSEGEDVPENLAARLQASWLSNAEDLEVTALALAQTALWPNT